MNNEDKRILKELRMPGPMDIDRVRIGIAIMIEKFITFEKRLEELEKYKKDLEREVRVAFKDFRQIQTDRDISDYNLGNRVDKIEFDIYHTDGLGIKELEKKISKLQERDNVNLKIFNGGFEELTKVVAELEKKIDAILYITDISIVGCTEEEAMKTYDDGEGYFSKKKEQEEPKEKEISFGQLQKNIDKNLKDADEKWKQSKEKEEKDCIDCRYDYENSCGECHDQSYWKLKERELEWRKPKEKEEPMGWMFSNTGNCLKINDLNIDEWFLDSQKKDEEIEKLQSEIMGLNVDFEYKFDLQDQKYVALEIEYEKLQMDLKIENTNYESVTNSFNILLKIHKEAIEFLKKNIFQMGTLGDELLEKLEKGGKE